MRLQKEKFRVKPFLKGLREFESRALKVFTLASVFVKKVPPEASDFHQVHNKPTLTKVIQYFFMRLPYAIRKSYCFFLFVIV